MSVFAGQMWRATMSWRGDAYAGWQIQPQSRTIQGEIERALGTLCDVVGPIRVSATGRTDSGVHAKMQIISFWLPVERMPHQVMAGINRHTDDDIVCLEASPVGADFSPRSWTKQKLYRYRILNRKHGCPFRSGVVWHLKQSLDMELMASALPALVGQYDFTSFRAARCSAKTTVRSIVDAEIRHMDDEIQIDFTGHGFLRHQIRIMVGTLVEVGLGRMSAEKLVEIRDARDRSQAGRTVPACGLTLVRVDLLDGPRSDDRYNLG
jgi:tRNA pseudouridine38-40 synthase